RGPGRRVWIGSSRKAPVICIPAGARAWGAQNPGGLSCKLDACALEMLKELERLRMSTISYEQIVQARAFLATYLPQTRLQETPTVSGVAHANVALKLES